MPGVLEVVPGVAVAQSRFWATNSTVIRAGSAVLLVDPGVHLDELVALAGALPMTAAVGAAVHTHAHWDHVLWCRELGVDVPRFVTAGTARYLAEHRAEVLAEIDAHVEGRDEDALLARGFPLADSAEVPWPGPPSILVETDAHLPGHGSLHVPDLGVLLAGDLVSDVDVPFPYWYEPWRGSAGPDGLPAYRAGLDRLAALDRVEMVVPGHGAPTDHAGFLARLDADRRYLDALESAVGRADSAGEAVEFADRIVDERLADSAVRAAHEESARSLFLRCSAA